MLVAIAGAAASFERLRRVHRAASFDFAALAIALGRSADASSLSEMRDLLVAEGAGWEAELVGVALATPSKADRAALVNEQLGDIGFDLAWGKGIPRASAWVSWLTGLFVIFFARARGPIVATDIVPVVGWAVMGVVVALVAGGEANKLEADVRRGIDSWVMRVLDAAGESSHRN
jgi:hypothetical protein